MTQSTALLMSGGNRQPGGRLISESPFYYGRGYMGKWSKGDTMPMQRFGRTRALAGFLWVSSRRAIPIRELALFVTAVLVFTYPLATPAAGAQYVYDAGGRLVQVIAPDGSSAQYSYDPAGNILSIKRLASSTLAETGTSTAGGAVGSTLTIYGSGFSTTASNNQVWINGVLCTVVSSTANSITVLIPSGATSGAIKITVGSNTVVSTASFNVVTATPAPTIATFSPQIAAAGATVSVTGTGFQTTASNDKVYFDRFQASISAATATTITTTVPSGYPSGHISVSTPYGTVASTQDFFVPPSGHVAADVGFTGRVTIDGATTAVTLSTAGKIGMVLLDGQQGQQISVQVSNQNFQSACYLGSINIFGSLTGSTSLGSTNLCTGAARFTLPKKGTYTLVVTPGSSSDTGSLSIKVANAPPVLGSITMGGGAVTATTTVPAQQAKLNFTTSVANQVVSVQVTNQTYPSNCAYGALAIVGPSPTTTQVGSTNFCLTATRFTLGAAGTYTIVVTPNGTDTGSISLQLFNATPVTGSITAGGSSVTATTTVPAQQAMLTFTSSAANQVVSVQVTSQTYPSNCGYGQLSVIGPSPATTQIGGANLCVNATRFTLAAAGTYTIVITPTGTDTGGVTLKLFNATPISGAIATNGTSLTATTTVPAQQAVLTFTSGTANQVVSVQVTSQTFPSNCAYGQLSVVGPSPATTQIGSANLCTSATRFTLGAAGTYSIVVTPNGSDTGSVTLKLFNATPITGSPTIGGSAFTVTTTVPAQQAILTFSTTTANQVVSLQVSGQTFPSNCASGSIQLVGPSPATTQIGNISFCSAATAFTLATAGTYTIVLTPNGADTGSITLQLYNTTPWTGTAATNGTATTMSITVPTQQGRLSFSGTSGQRISLQTSSDTLSGTGGFFYLSLLNPDGSVAYSSGLTGGPSFGPFTLTQTGTFTFVVNPYGSGTGSLNMQVYNVPADASAAATTNGSTNTLTLGTPGQAGAVTFSGTSGQRISVQTLNSTFPNYFLISILNPDGSNVLSSQLTSGGFYGPYTLTQTGTFKVLIQEYNGTTGSVGVQVYNVPADTSAAVSANGAANTVTLGAPGQSGALTFSATSGQRISLQAANTSFPSYFYISVLNPDGSSVLGSSLTGGGFYGPYTLTQSGTFKVVISPYNGGTGSASVKIYTVPADTTTAATVNGTAVTATLGTPGQSANVTFSGTSGHTVTVQLSNSTFASWYYVSITSPSGATVLSQRLAGGSNAYGPLTLSETGTFKITIAPYNGGTGSLTVVLTGS